MTDVSKRTEVVRTSYRGYTVVHNTTINMFWVEKDRRIVLQGSSKSNCRRQIDNLLAPKKTKSWGTAW